MNLELTQPREKSPLSPDPKSYYVHMPGYPLGIHIFFPEILAHSRPLMEHGNLACAQP